jgi:uncharacterized OB-fold protein
METSAIGGCDNSGTLVGRSAQLRAAHLPAEISVPIAARQRELYHFSGRGEVYSFTTVYQAPAGFEQEAPIQWPWSGWKRGPLVTAQLTDLGDRAVQIGMPVEMVTASCEPTASADVVYGYKFRPLLNGKS